MRRTNIVGLTSMLVVAGLGGCGFLDRPEVFTADTACDIDAGAVENLLGTDRFEQDPPDGVLPLTPARTAAVTDYRCAISPGVGPATGITIEIDDQLGVDTFDSYIDRDPFDVAGGEGRGTVYPSDDDRFTGVWTCGFVTGTVRGSSADWTEEAVRDTVEQLADDAGCYGPGDDPQYTGEAPGGG